MANKKDRLEVLEDKLMTMFNEAYKLRDEGDTSEGDVDIRKSATYIANSIVTIRQQRQFESGETRIVENNRHATVRRYIKKQI